MGVATLGLLQWIMSSRVFRCERGKHTTLAMRISTYVASLLDESMTVCPPYSRLVKKGMNSVYVASE